MKRLKRVLHLCLAVSVLLSAGVSARAFSPGDANTAWQAYKQQFYYVINGNEGYFRNQQGVGNTATTYQLAYCIEAAVDARDVTVVNNTINGFVALYGTNPATWDVAEDDNMTFALVFAAAYQLTGNSSHLTMAENIFNTSYNRAWDSANGGGLMRIVPGVKSAQVNGPGCLAAILIYQSGGGSAYLTKAQAIYNWMINNVWNSQTGQVNATPGDTSNPLSADASYFAACAHYMGNDTNMTLAGDFVKNRWGTGMQGFGPGSFLGSVNSVNLRWLAKSGYNTSFLQACCDKGLTCKNSSGLVGPDFDETTSESAAYAFDCTNLVAGLWCVPPGGQGAGNPIGPTGYTWCANENGSFTPGQSVDVAYGGAGNFVYRNSQNGTITFNNATFGDPAPGSVKAGFFRFSGNHPVGPVGFTWCASENGTFNPGPAAEVAYGANGVYNFKLGVTGNFTFNNATFGDPTPNVAKAGFYRYSSTGSVTPFALFVRSTGQALDASGAGSTNGTPLIQSTYHGGNNQRWYVTSLGNGQYNAFGVASFRSAEVNGASQSNNAVVDLWDYAGGNNQKFTLADQGGGYYNVVFVHSGKAMQVLNNSSSNGAAIVQYTLGANGANAQWQFRAP